MFTEYGWVCEKDQENYLRTYEDEQKFATEYVRQKWNVNFNCAKFWCQYTNHLLVDMKGDKRASVSNWRDFCWPPMVGIYFVQYMYKNVYKRVF